MPRLVTTCVLSFLGLTAPALADAGGAELPERIVDGTYLVGNTNSVDFPVTPTAVQTRFGGGPADAFVVKLD